MLEIWKTTIIIRAKLYSNWVKLRWIILKWDINWSEKNKKSHPCIVNFFTCSFYLEVYQFFVSIKYIVQKEWKIKQPYNIEKTFMGKKIFCLFRSFLDIALAVFLWFMYNTYLLSSPKAILILNSFA